jgi:hypothetical protein
MSLKLHTETQKIDNIFLLADRVDYDDDYDEEVVSHLARYLCVLTSGLVEECLRHMISEYVRDHANEVVARFAQQRIDRITNLNEERLGQLIGAMRPEWRDRFFAEVTDAQRGAITSVTADRHLIAHGRSVAVSLNQVRAYYDRVVEVLEWFESVCAQS